METSFQASTKREIHVGEGMITQHLAHKTPPRVPPKPTSKSPPSYVSKVTAGRQQSPSPVRHVKGPTPTPVRYASVISVQAGGHLNWLHELTDLRVVVYRPVSPSTKLSVSPIRPVKSPIMTRKQVRASIWSLLSLVHVAVCLAFQFAHQQIPKQTWNAAYSMYLTVLGAIFRCGVATQLVTLILNSS